MRAALAFVLLLGVCAAVATAGSTSSSSSSRSGSSSSSSTASSPSGPPPEKWCSIEMNGTVLKKMKINSMKGCAKKIADSCRTFGAQLPKGETTIWAIYHADSTSSARASVTCDPAAKVQSGGADDEFGWGVCSLDYDGRPFVRKSVRNEDACKEMSDSNEFAAKLCKKFNVPFDKNVKFAYVHKDKRIVVGEPTQPCQGSENFKPTSWNGYLDLENASWNEEDSESDSLSDSFSQSSSSSTSSSASSSSTSSSSSSTSSSSSGRSKSSSSKSSSSSGRSTSSSSGRSSRRSGSSSSKPSSSSSSSSSSSRSGPGRTSQDMTLDAAKAKWVETLDEMDKVKQDLGDRLQALRKTTGVLAKHCKTDACRYHLAEYFYHARSAYKLGKRASNERKVQVRANDKKNKSEEAAKASLASVNAIFDTYIDTDKAMAKSLLSQVKDKMRAVWRTQATRAKLHERVTELKRKLKKLENRIENGRRPGKGSGALEDYLNSAAARVDWSRSSSSGSQSSSKSSSAKSTSSASSSQSSSEVDKFADSTSSSSGSPFGN